MSQLTLSLAIHNHHPVGNFDHIFAEAADMAYAPMLQALARHQGVRLTLHYSGSLLDWLAANRPDHLEHVADLVAGNRSSFSPPPTTKESSNRCFFSSRE